MNQAPRELAIARPDRRAAGARARPEPPADRRAERLAAAERSLADAHATMMASGVNPDSVNTAFAIVRDLIAEAREFSARLQAELALAQRERIQAQRDRADTARYPDTSADPVVPDLPSLDLCPNPRDVQTPAQLTDMLRNYWIWAGRPSYRAMERKCSRRFAASTLHTALHASKLPSLEMLQAIITACGGSIEHREAFASAWRRLEMPQDEAGQPAALPPRPRSLFPVSEPA
jgi:hypothetical protein